MSAKITKATVEYLKFPLAQAVGGSGVTGVDVVVVDLEDANGVIATGFTYGLRGGGTVIKAAAEDLCARLVIGQAADEPLVLFRQLAGSLNRLGRGVYFMAIAAIDMAVWDLHAKQRGIPLYQAMGGRARAVPVYGSGGYTANQAPEAAVAQALKHVQQGFPAVKLRLAGERADIARMQAVRAALPAEIDLMVDTNEKCDLNRALWLARECAELGVLWLEEPLPALDYAAHAQLARSSPVSIATGEHLQGCVEVMPLLQANACSVIQPDLAAIGGLSETLRVCQQAEFFGVTVSPHFLPALFIHVACAAPNVTWLEDFPLLEPLFKISVKIDAKQRMSPGDAPGHGMAWADGARAAYRVKV
ncbi:MAG: mandelate racemase/muconate lactonizing enzyme family protein [Alphaproteobacteria bacterium]